MLAIEGLKATVCADMGPDAEQFRIGLLTLKALKHLIWSVSVFVPEKLLDEAAVDPDFVFSQFHAFIGFKVLLFIIFALLFVMRNCGLVFDVLARQKGQNDRSFIIFKAQVATSMRC